MWKPNRFKSMKFIISRDTFPLPSSSNNTVQCEHFKTARYFSVYYYRNLIAKVKKTYILINNSAYSRNDLLAN